MARAVRRHDLLGGEPDLVRLRRQVVSAGVMEKICRLVALLIGRRVAEQGTARVAAGPSSRIPG